MVKYNEVKTLYDEFDRKLIMLNSIACRIDLVHEYNGLKAELNRLCDTILELTK